MPNAAKIPRFSSSLAPMRGLTGKNFQKMISDFGSPDEYFSEFLRVHPTSTVDDEIINLFTDRNDNVPIHLQLLGRDPEHFLRICNLIKKFKIASINLNFGCPMPKICKKGVGGTLLLEIDQIDRIMDAMMTADCEISVKTRIGYYSRDELPNILDHLSKYDISALYLHARTVKGMYSENVDYDAIKFAKHIMRCRVIANGDIKSAQQAVDVVEYTHADGVMIGRAAIVNPWIFRQISDIIDRRAMFSPRNEDYLDYLQKLIANFCQSGAKNIGGLKRYIVPLADHIGGNGSTFARTIRRAQTVADVENLFSEFLS